MIYEAKLGLPGVFPVPSNGDFVIPCAGYFNTVKLRGMQAYLGKQKEACFQ
jgi:hypothetical protein